MEFGIAIIIGLIWAVARNQHEAMAQRRQATPARRRDPLHQHAGVWHEHEHEHIHGHVHHPYNDGLFINVGDEDKNRPILVNWETGTYTVLPDDTPPTAPRREGHLP
jgi:hypothetical protein